MDLITELLKLLAALAALATAIVRFLSEANESKSEKK